MSDFVCPWWLGYLLLNPVRRLIHNPDKILSSYVSKNMKVLDVGSAMGFFSLPMAKLVGEKGKVVCVDLQEKMIEALVKRVRKEGLENTIETRVCSTDSLKVDDLREEMDFVLTFAVVHEVPDKDRLFKEIIQVLKPGGSMLIAEPKGHVGDKAFADSVALAEKNGFNIVERPLIGKSYAVLLKKKH